MLSATLVVFLFAYLNLNRWHVRAWHVAALWLALLVGLVALAALEAPIAAGVARISLGTVAVVGFVLILYLASHGYDRAIMLIPTWFLLLLWVIAGGFTVLGWLTNDLVSPALIGGLVLIVMLIGFTVMQNAFAGGGLAQGVISDIERKALALTGANEIVFDWDVPSDHIFVSPEVEAQLGLDRGGLEGAAASWLNLLHPFEQDRYRACLDAILEQRRGRIDEEFRLRAADGHYLCFRLRARPVVGPDGEVIRVVGTLVDVTEERSAQERLLHDAVHDNLTGLPNRELFFDRLEAALSFARTQKDVRPTVLMIDLDRFKQVNEQVGVATGDSVLLTIAHRISRLLQPRDTLARMAGDSFAILLLSQSNSESIMATAESVRRALATPVRFTDHEVSLFASIGVAFYDPALHGAAADMQEDAEIAMRKAKRSGGNCIEVFRQALRGQRSDRLTLETDLRRALERNEVKVFFQPIVRLEDHTIAGFEALLRWDHPRLGRLDADEFLSVAEESGLVLEFAMLALDRTARELAAWQRALDCRSADLRLGQSSLPPAPVAGSAQECEERADAQRDRARQPEARAQRSRGDGEPGIFGANAGAPQGARRGAGARRFRLRLFLARLSAAISLRHGQDRPLLRQADGGELGVGGAALHHSAGARARHGRRRGRRRKRERRRRALQARLRLCAGPRLWPPDQPAGGAPPDRRGARGGVAPGRSGHALRQIAAGAAIVALLAKGPSRKDIGDAHSLLRR